MHLNLHPDSLPNITPISKSVGDSPTTTIEAIGDASGARKSKRRGSTSKSSNRGYCQSGQIMSASALLASNPNPTHADIDAAMSGNICRCGTYVRIRQARSLGLPV